MSIKGIGDVKGKTGLFPDRDNETSGKKMKRPSIIEQLEDLQKSSDALRKIHQGQHGQPMASHGDSDHTDAPNDTDRHSNHGDHSDAPHSDHENDRRHTDHSDVSHPDHTDHQDKGY
jgi:hypothetical protein